VSEWDRSTTISAAALRFFGGALKIIGALIATLTGLCTAVVGIPILSSNQWGSFASKLRTVIISGVIPFAIGVGIYLLGRALYRRGDHR
jgi:hypothetical protein